MVAPATPLAEIATGRRLPSFCTTKEGQGLTISNRGSALAYRRQEAYERLAEIDAYRLLLAGCAVTVIAGRADTTPFIVRRWLREVVGRRREPRRAGGPILRRNPRPRRDQHVPMRGFRWKCGRRQAIVPCSIPTQAGMARCPKKPNGQKRQMMVTCHPAAGWSEDQAPGGAGVVTYRTFEMTEDMADSFYPMGWYFQRD